MASRGFSKALRSPLARQVVAPAQRRTFVAAASLIRAKAAVSAVVPAKLGQQQVRGVKTIDFAGSPEKVWGEFSEAMLWESEGNWSGRRHRAVAGLFSIALLTSFRRA